MAPKDLDASLNRWIAESRPRWVRLANQALRDRHEAEDVVQETATKLWQRLSKGDVEDRDAYAARAVWQNALKRVKRRKRHATLDFEPAAPESEDPEPDLSLLEAALAGLPEAQRTVVRMKFYGGLTFKEIGETLSISINTAASRTRYALAALRETLRPRGGNDGS